MCLRRYERLNEKHEAIKVVKLEVEKYNCNIDIWEKDACHKEITQVTAKSKRMGS